MTTYAGRAVWPQPFMDHRGNARVGLVVSVYEAGTTNPATLYTDRTKSDELLSNSTTTDDDGNLWVFADPGDYDYVVDGETKSFSVLPDPAESGGGGGPATGVGDYAGYSSIGGGESPQHFADGAEALVTMGTVLSSEANGYLPDESGGTSFDIDIAQHKVTCLFNGLVQAFFNVDFDAQEAPLGVAYFHVNHSSYWQFSWSSYAKFPLAASWNAAGNGGGLGNTGIMPVTVGDELTVTLYVGATAGGAGADLILYQIEYLRVG